MKQIQNPEQHSRLYRIFRKLLLWTIIPYILLQIGLWFFHPEDDLISRIVDRIYEESGVLIEYTDVSLTRTFGIEFTNLRLKQTGDRTIVISGQSIAFKAAHLFAAESFTIRVNLSSLLHLKAGLHFNSSLYGGSASGVLEAPFSRKGNLTVKAIWKNIDLAQVTKEFPISSVTSGQLSGDTELEFNPDLGNSGFQGPLNFDVRGMAMALPQNVGDLMNFHDMNSITGVIHADFDIVQIKEIILKGSTGTMKVTGLMQPNPIPENTYLDLNIKLYAHKPDEPLNENQYLPVTIKGLSGKPTIDFLGISLYQDGELKTPF